MWWIHCIDWTNYVVVPRNLCTEALLHIVVRVAEPNRFRLSSCLLCSTQILYTRWVLYPRKPGVSTMFEECRPKSALGRAQEVTRSEARKWMAASVAQKVVFSASNWS